MKPFGKGGWLAVTLVAAPLFIQCAGSKPKSDESTGAPATTSGGGSVAKAPLSASGATGPTTGKHVPIQLFVMSKCEFCPSVERQLRDVVKFFGGAAELTVDYIGKVDEKGGLTSMHGPEEVDGDILQLCVMKHSAKWLDFILCQNADQSEVTTNWDECAKQLGISTHAIEKCAESAEGRDLLTASFKRAEALGVKGAPTVFIDAKKFEGARRRSAFMKTVCAAQGTEKGAACDHIPEGPPVNVVILSDARCPECNTKNYETAVSARFENPVIKNVDVGSADGAALLAAIAPAHLLPAVVFDKTLDADTEVNPLFVKKLQAIGDYKVLEGKVWNPRCADTNGCSLAECKDELVCVPEVANKLELFMMGRCPFAAKGVTSLREVFDNFNKNKAKIDFSISFIGEGDKEHGLHSMHGDDEVAEDLRMVCAIAHYGKNLKFLDYMICRSKDVKSNDWESCTGGSTGIDAKVLRACSEGDEGKNLLTASFAYSAKRRITASPTWIANGKYKFTGLDADTIKKGVCAHNKLGGCDVTLSGPPEAAPSP
ncbi:MAG: thioredoxin domain-containing protein [Polyangiaceae bacterium]